MRRTRIIHFQVPPFANFPSRNADICQTLSNPNRIFSCYPGKNTSFSSVNNSHKDFTSNYGFPNSDVQSRASNGHFSIVNGVISKCSHIWEKKEENFAESSLQGLLSKLSNYSPETIRPFWRVFSLKPEDVFKILLGFDYGNPTIESRNVNLLWILFNWAPTQSKVVFNNIPESYNIMLSMLIRTSMLEEAESLLQTMDARGVSPDYKIYSMLIEGYVGNCKLEKSLVIYERARDRGISLSTSCCEALVDLLIRRSRTTLGLRVCMHILEAGLNVKIRTFEVVVAALCKDGKVHEARRIVEQGVRLGFEPSRMVLNKIINVYNNRNESRWLLDFLEEHKYAPDAHLCNKIIASQCRNVGEENARLFMERLIDLGFVPDEITFGILISWSCREGKLKIAFTHLSEFFLRCLKPDFYIYNALISGIFKAGFSRHSKEILYDMVERGITLDISTFRVMLAGYCKERKFDEAKQILGEMLNHGMLEHSGSLDPLSRVFTVLGLDQIGVKVKRDNVAGLPRAEFYDALGNGLYLETDLEEFEKIVAGILDEAINPNFASVVAKEFSDGNIEAALKLHNEMVQRGQKLSLASYSEILKGLCAQCHADVVIDLLNEIPELGHQLDHGTLNVIIQYLAKQKMASKARSILDELIHREQPVETDTYAALIDGFCMEENLAEFQDCLELAQKNGWFPRLGKCKNLLGFLCKWGLINKALELVENMLANEPYSTSNICNMFLEELCFMGFTQVGCILVETFLERGLILDHTAAYSHLIIGFIREKRSTEALKIFEIMIQKNLTPSMNVCKLLIPQLCMSQKMKEALNLKEILLINQPVTAVNIYNAMINGLCRIEMVWEASFQLIEMLTKGLTLDDDIFNLMIKGHCYKNNLNKALELLCIMLKQNLELSISSYTYLVRLMCMQGRVLDALSLKKVLLRAVDKQYPSVILYNILISHLFQTGNSFFVTGLLDEMHQQCLVMDHNTYNILICGFSKCKFFTKSVETLCIMIEKNLQPSNRSLKNVVEYYCNKGEIEKALELSNTMEFRGWKHGSIIQTLLVESLLSKGRIWEAESFLNRMDEKDLIPNNICYDIVIKRLCGYGRLNKATDLLNVMLKKGSSPTNTSYNLLIQGFCTLKAFDQALDLHAEMLHKNLEPSISSCEILVRGLCGNGRTYEARKLLSEMLQWGRTPTCNMFQSVIDQYCLENKHDKASEVLQEMQRHGFVPDFKTHWSLITNLSNVNDKDNNNKGFLSQLLSHSGFSKRDSRSEGCK